MFLLYSLCLLFHEEDGSITCRNFFFFKELLVHNFCLEVFEKNDVLLKLGFSIDYNPTHTKKFFIFLCRNKMKASTHPEYSSNSCTYTPFEVRIV